MLPSIVVCLHLCLRLADEWVGRIVYSKSRLLFLF